MTYSEEPKVFGQAQENLNAETLPGHGRQPIRRLQGDWVCHGRTIVPGDGGGEFAVEGTLEGRTLTCDNHLELFGEMQVGDEAVRLSLCFGFNAMKESHQLAVFESGSPIVAMHEGGWDESTSSFRFQARFWSAWAKDERLHKVVASFQSRDALILTFEADEQDTPMPRLVLECRRKDDSC